MIYFHRRKRLLNIHIYTNLYKKGIKKTKGPHKVYDYPHVGSNHSVLTTSKHSYCRHEQCICMAPIPNIADIIQTNEFLLSWRRAITRLMAIGENYFIHLRSRSSPRSMCFHWYKYTLRWYRLHENKCSALFYPDEKCGIIQGRLCVMSCCYLINKDFHITFNDIVLDVTRMV